MTGTSSSRLYFSTKRDKCQTKYWLDFTDVNPLKLSLHFWGLKAEESAPSCAPLPKLVITEFGGSRFGRLGPLGGLPLQYQGNGARTPLSSLNYDVLTLPLLRFKIGTYSSVPLSKIQTAPLE